MSEIRQPTEPSAQADLIDMEEERRQRRRRRLFTPYAAALAQQKGQQRSQRRRATAPRPYSDAEPQLIKPRHRHLSESAIDAIVHDIAQRKAHPWRWRVKRLWRWAWGW